jgi:NADPH:quinone reductase-like Zn-dependent oxidoreductase
LSNYAIVIKQAGKAEIRKVTVPTLRDDYINVKVHAVALNPTDWKHVDYLASSGARVAAITQVWLKRLARKSRRVSGRVIVYRASLMDVTQVCKSNSLPLLWSA